MIWLIIILFVQLGAIAYVLLAEYRNPAKTAAWLLLLFIFPIIGFVMYFFLGERYRRTPASGYSERRGHVGNDWTDSGAACGSPSCRPLPEQAVRYSKLFPDAAVTCCNRTKVLANGEETFRAILSAIEAAHSYVHLDYYTIRDDAIGQALQRALCKKAQQGLDIRIIYDGAGSYALSDSYVRELSEAGVRCRPFLPLLPAFFHKRINYRNHRKLVVVDGMVGFLGGINFGDEYLGKDPKLGFWRDTHLQVEGAAVVDLQRAFFTDWRLVSGEFDVEPSRHFPRCAADEGELVQIIASGPDQRGDQMEKLFFAMITGAKERLWIVTPYFIPDPPMMAALKLAAAQGVNVKVIIPGAPDTRIVHWASLSYVRELIRVGISFYQYQKGFIHSKVMIVDGQVATVGSANMDMRSFYSNFELNAVLFESVIINRLEQDFAADLQDSAAMEQEKFAQWSIGQRTKAMVARILSPLF